MPADNENPAEKTTARDEIVYFTGSPALRGSLGLLFWYSILGAVAIIGGWLLRAYGLWIPPVGVLLAVILLVAPVILTRSVRYRVTSYRIDFERGVFSKDIDTLELWHVEDIKFHQSLLDRLMGIGTITVMSHDDTTPTLRLQSLPNPRPIFESLKQRIIAVKRQRGVIKLDS